jgi:hypothetical protein
MMPGDSQLELLRWGFALGFGAFCGPVLLSSGCLEAATFADEEAIEYIAVAISEASEVRAPCCAFTASANAEWPEPILFPGSCVNDGALLISIDLGSCARLALSLARGRGRGTGADIIALPLLAATT